MNWRQYISNQHLLKSILILSSGTLMSQVIAIVLSPLLSRIYTPADFGVQAIILLGGSILFAIASGKYELGIVLPANDREASRLVNLAIGLSLIVAFAATIIGFLLLDHIESIIQLGNHIYLILFIPLFAWFNTIFESLRMYALRHKQFQLVSQSLWIKAIATAILQITLGLMSWGSLGLVVGMVGALLFGNVRLWILYNKNKDIVQNTTNQHITWRNLAIKYIKFPKYTMPGIALNSISQQLPVLFFQSFYNSTLSGYFSMTQRVLNLPMVAVGNAIGDSFYQKISDDHRNDVSFVQTTWKLYQTLLLIGILPTCIVHFWAEPIFSFVFGAPWLRAGTYASILCFWTLAVFITSPISNVIFVHQKNKIGLIFQLIVFFSRLLLFGGAIYYGWKDLEILTIYGWVGAILFFGFILYILNHLGIHWTKPFRFTVVVVSIAYGLTYSLHYLTS